MLSPDGLQEFKEYCRTRRRRVIGYLLLRAEVASSPAFFESIDTITGDADLNRVGRLDGNAWQCSVPCLCGSVEGLDLIFARSLSFEAN